MSDLSPEDAESIIEAAAAGRSAAADPELSAALGALHDPLPLAAGQAPTVGSKLAGTARYARRTAAMAAIGVMSLVGVAAAGTAGIVLLADDEPEATIGEDLEDDAPESTTTTSTTTSTTTTTAAPVDDVDDDEGEDESEDDERERGDEIEGVDASDGLDDDELEKLCDAAVNHGEYVSAVARDKETEVEGARGQRVSEAAQSDCGKSDDESDEDADDESDESDEDDADEDESDEDDESVDHTDGPGNGNGKAKGHERNGKAGSED